MFARLSALVLLAQGAFQQVAAWDSYAYGRNYDTIERSPCGDLNHCRGNYGHHGHHGHHEHDGRYVPDPRTIFFPHGGYEYGRRWPLCKDGSYCHERDAFGNVKFDFHRGDVIFELENRYGYYFEDVEIYIQINGPPTDRSYRLDRCYSERHGYTKCRVPYHELVRDDPHHRFCPIKNRGSWVFYVQIKAIARRGHEIVHVYNRGINHKDCWFSFSFCCTECRHHHGHPHRLSHRSYKDESFKLPKEVEKFREQNRYEEGFDCDGALVAVYGRTKTCRPLKELSHGHSHKSCDGKEGVYQRATKRELEVGVRGELEAKHKHFGNWVISLDKNGPDTTVSVKIDVDERDKVKVTEAAIFIKCDAGDEKHGEDICKPETWPLTFANSKGVGDYQFQLINKLQCKGDYFIAVWVKACLEKDKCPEPKPEPKPCPYKKPEEKPCPWKKPEPKPCDKYEHKYEHKYENKHDNKYEGKYDGKYEDKYDNKYE